MKLLLCLLSMLLVVLSAQAGSLYRWVDSAGNVHYADQPPPQDVKEVQEKKLAKPASPSGQTPYAAQAAARNFPVSLYATNCGEICTRSREHLTKRGIPFSDKNPTEPEVADELQKLTGSLEIPVLVVGKASPIRGYGAESWDAALDVAGYPKAAAAKPASSAKPAATAKTEQPAETRQEYKTK
jgi:Domain of unknown function (DUF4124)